LTVAGVSTAALFWLALKLAAALTVIVTALLSFSLRGRPNQRAYEIDLTIMFAALAVSMLTLDTLWLPLRVVVAAFLAIIAIAIYAGKLSLRP
jgi:hypothetical protein